MISTKMQKAINDQINAELFSAYYYLSMAAYLDSADLEGMANFMKIQAQEETTHAMKFYHYMYEQGADVVLQAIEQPKVEFKSALEVFTLGREHEALVTSKINDLVKIALEENDYATKAFLDWFVTEQVEEEATMDGIVKKLKMVGDHGHGLLMMDAQLGQRTFTPSAEEA